MHMIELLEGIESSPNTNFNEIKANEG